jgi:hypothetical protein
VLDGIDGAVVVDRELRLRAAQQVAEHVRRDAQLQQPRVEREAVIVARPELARYGERGHRVCGRH